MHHLDTHAFIDRGKSVGEIIEDNIGLTIAHQKHYVAPPGSFPSDGWFVIPADGEQWRSFSLARVQALPVIGGLLTAAMYLTDGQVSAKRWTPATFIVKAVAGETDEHVDMDHLRLPDTVDTRDISVSEVGVGRVWFNHRREVVSMASVALTKAMRQGEVSISARAYARIPDLGVDLLIGSAKVPDVETCKDFLQIQRDAMWNTTWEPI